MYLFSFKQIWLQNTNHSETIRNIQQLNFNFFRFYHSVMIAQWRLLECFKVMKSQPSTSIFMSLAIFAVIATVANVAKIAYEDRSLVVNFFLFVIIIQVKPVRFWTFTKVSILILLYSALEKPLLGLAVSFR